LTDIFISYRREDSAGHAGRLYDGLEALFPGSRIFMDVDAIAPGVDFTEQIADTVAACDVLLVLIGRDWSSITDERGTRRLDDPKDIVRLEIEVGLRREGEIEIVPVLVQDALMPGADELPPTVAPVTRLNAIELSDARWHYDLERLKQAIENAAGKKRRPPPRPTENLSVGIEFAGYAIEEPIAERGFSTLYRAVDPRSGRASALKLFTPELANDREFLRRLERDAAMAGSVNHPHIIEVYEIGDENGVLFVARRWIRGSDIGSTVEAYGALSPSRASRLIYQAADALSAAHEIGLVHGNVHTGNLLVSDRDQVWVSDFGLTKHAISTKGVTRTGLWLGTVDYVAPEQVKGLQTTPACDIYSLGCVLFQCLTGRVPYAEDTQLAKLWAHIEKPPPSFEQFPDVPKPVQEVVQQATAKEPADRYTSAADFGRAALAAATGSA
jgi:hypothetical protein